MREQKTMRNGTFFEPDSAQCCHHIGYENATFGGKGYVFFKKKIQKVAEVRVGVFIYYIGKGYFLT